MAEFQPITTQEAFDEMIKERIGRARAKEAERFADYDELKASKEANEKTIAELQAQIEASKNQASEFESKKADYEKNIAELNEKVSKAEIKNVRLDVAISAGLPIELADRLSGATADELKADAENLVKMIGARNSAPLRNPETPAAADGVAAAFAKLNPNIKL